MVVVDDRTALSPAASGAEDPVVREVAVAADAADVVRAVLAGRSAVIYVAEDAPADVVDSLWEDLHRVATTERRSAADVVDGLDQEALALLRAGKSRRDTAAALHMSLRSLDRRLANIRTRLGVDSTAEAIMRHRP